LPAVTYEEAQELARSRGVSRPVYGLIRFVILPLVKLIWRFRIRGADHIPKDGPCVIAPNHKSFYDSFFVGLATPRHVRFMAKNELFEGRSARLLSMLGAFPVRRGEADPEALETARMILREGGVLALFPEGTRHRDADALRAPRRGAGRLAIEAGAPIVPCAISGTEKLFAGFFPRPVRVQIAFAAPIAAKDLESTPEAAADLIENQVWPEVERQFRDLRSRQGLIAALLAALAAGGGVALRRQQRKPRTRVEKIKAKLPKRPAQKRRTGRR
jgi:1-acyl-sn-glycerol-3-phosphate acyltransferase